MNNSTDKSSNFIEFETPIDVKDLFKIIFEKKIPIFIFSLLLSIISVFYALSLTDYFESESLMSVRDINKNRSMTNFGGAASLLGIDISKSGENKTMQAIELIKSRKFMKHLLTFDKVLPSIMAAKSFDKETKSIIFDYNLYDSDKNEWKNDDFASLSKPSYLDAHGVFIDDLLTISLDKNTGFIKLNIKHVSPIFARDFLSLIIDESNNILRQKDLIESEQAIKYLKTEIAKTSLIDIRDSINNLIEAQLEIQMMSNINEDYVLIIIDPPYIPEKSLGNSKLLIVIFSFIFGLLISSLYFLTRYLYEKKFL